MWKTKLQLSVETTTSREEYDQFTPLTSANEYHGDWITVINKGTMREVPILLSTILYDDQWRSRIQSSIVSVYSIELSEKQTSALNIFLQ